jgi:RAB6A-GEF complex partner protein 1
MADASQIRLFSRDQALDGRQSVCQKLTAPVITFSTYGPDSLLVYTRENVLYHFILSTTNGSTALALAGQIAFHGIIRAPLRVRAVTWLLPEHQTCKPITTVLTIVGAKLMQLVYGEPSQDVSVASLLFLVDGKLVLLQPSATNSGDLKYDLRMVAQRVEYFVMPRAQFASDLLRTSEAWPENDYVDPLTNRYQTNSLRDSLWFFDGTRMSLWADFQDVLKSSTADYGNEMPAPIPLSFDFYPISVLLPQGLVSGGESELVQRRDLCSYSFKITTRVRITCFEVQVLANT